MKIEGHSHVQPHKFGEVPVRVRVFRPKHGSDREHSIEISRYRHLLIKLQRLSQVCGTFEAGHLEHVRATFTSCRYDLGRVDLTELFQTRSKQFAKADSRSR